MKNTGKLSEKLFQEIFSKLGKRCFVFRVVDASEVQGRTKGRGWVRSQPSDWLVTENGEMYYAETKSTTSKTKFCSSSITTMQKASARRQIAAGGKYYFFIHRLETNDWYKVPAEVILNSSKASFRWNELNSYRWELAYAS